MYLIKNKKSKYFQILFTVNGKKTTVSTKTSNRKEAEVFLQYFKNTVNKHSEYFISDQPKPKLITLFEFGEEYIEYCKNLKSKSYLKSIKNAFTDFEKFTGDIKLSKIDQQLIDKYITFTFARTQRGAHMYFRTLKAAFSKAENWNYIKLNPFIKVKFPRLPKSYPIFISKEEFIIILSFVPSPLFEDIFTTAFYTGMRLGELVNMQWSWIDWEQNFIQIKNSDSFNSKSKKERIIPMNKKVLSILKNRYSLRKPNNLFIFYKVPGIKLNEDHVSKTFKKAVKKSGLNPKIHFHTLRHSFASMLVQKGISLFIVKELLGHEDLKTTQIYSHLQNKNLSDAVNLL